MRNAATKIDRKQMPRADDSLASLLSWSPSERGTMCWVVLCVAGIIICGIDAGQIRGADTRPGPARLYCEMFDYRGHHKVRAHQATKMTAIGMGWGRMSAQCK